MSEARDTSGLLATQTPGTKRSLSYSETEDHQFSTEAPSPKLYRAGLNRVQGCCHWEDTHALRMIVAWMATVAVVVFGALVVEIITQVHIVETGDVVTDHPNCSQIGLDILKDGGNAVDAAVAAGLCLSVTVPDRAGLGGGGVIMIHHLRSNTTTTIDFQAVSPSGLHIQDYQSNIKISQSGPESVGVPGLVAGLHYAQHKYGSRAVKINCCSWNDLVSKTVHLLSQGFTGETWWTEYLQQANISPDLQKFLRAQGYSQKDSDLNNKMQRTLSSLLGQDQEPVESFYQGRLATVLSAETKLSKSDLANYSVVERPALRAQVGEYDIITSPAPTSGPELIAILNAIETIIGNNSLHGFDTQNYVEKLKNVLENVHQQQRLLGDPAADSVHQSDENYVKTADRMNNLISKENVGKWISERSGRQQLRSDGRSSLPSGSVVTVMDNQDIYVSMILSLNSPFGSQQLSNAGFLLNNALNGFEPPVQQPGDTSSNELYEGLRPLSRSAPVVAVNKVTACKTRIVMGGMAELVAQVLGHVIVGNFWDHKRILDESRLVVVNNTVVVQQKSTEDFLSKQDIPAKSSLDWGKINLLEKNQDTVSGHSEGGRDGWKTLKT